MASLVLLLMTAEQVRNIYEVTHLSLIAILSTRPFDVFYMWFPLTIGDYKYCIRSKTFEF
jgi:hypothetical protein